MAILLWLTQWLFFSDMAKIIMAIFSWKLKDPVWRKFKIMAILLMAIFLYQKLAICTMANFCKILATLDFQIMA